MELTEEYKLLCLKNKLRIRRANKGFTKTNKRN